ncbi:two-component system, OmpR family, sensor histidine kinase MtrB [Saccharopolyspora shandongensis]|uniref:Signal transduction histidine-protein kinase/phosphatase MprB n=1 Tax=Saccharopolyspora shandongensis TaxID=418495 RepID=A0A1H3BCA7_9PSEU|nr:two-component system, OmpR family, sensor histidine kinase MtrB [Saccharopolyspora shandongensis]
MRTPRFLSGLRVRLIFGFLLVSMAAVAAATVAGYATARSSLLAADQNSAVADVRQRVTALAPDLTYPPDQPSLDALAAQLPTGATVVYHDLRAPETPLDPVISPELQAAVRIRSRVEVQQVGTSKGPALAIGMPVLTRQLSGTSVPSGLEVYVVHDLSAIQQQINAQARMAWLTGVLAVPLAVLVALLSARGVLRPVRELRRATVRLSGGDLTARLQVRGNDELAELASTFNNSAAELERIVSELRRMEADSRRFVADVSHELRTPLSAMIAVTDILEGEASRMSDNAARSARLLVRETRRLTRLVEDLIEVSRFDAGSAQLVQEDVDAGEAVRATLDARRWTDAVQLELPDGLGARLDRRRLDVIVANLVGNALRHGRPPVSVVLRDTENRIELEVTDHGPGLSPDVLPHVFDRFYKADAVRTRSESSGLGLAIAQANAQLHGGDIQAGNWPEGGARFVLRMPRHNDTSGPIEF